MDQLLLFYCSTFFFCITVGINGQWSNWGQGSGNSQNQRNPPMYVPIGPGLFQLDVVSAKRLDLHGIIRSTNQQQNNRRRGDHGDEKYELNQRERSIQNYDTESQKYTFNRRKDIQPINNGPKPEQAMNEEVQRTIRSENATKTTQNETSTPANNRTIEETQNVIDKNKIKIEDKMNSTVLESKNQTLANITESLTKVKLDAPTSRTERTEVEKAKTK